MALQSSKLSFVRGKVHSDLRIGADVSGSATLLANADIAGTGLILGSRGFVIDREKAESLKASSSYADGLLFPLKTGRDIASKDRGLYVIDTDGWTEQELSEKVPSIYQHLWETVYPERQTNRDIRLRNKWWLFRRSNEQVRKAISNLRQYIVTPETAKYPVFSFLDVSIKPEHGLVVIGSSDSFLLGVLSSQMHTFWSLTAGGNLGGNTPRYQKNLCFDPFPFPVPALEQKQKIRELGNRLDTHRKQVQAAHPEITITGMYNLLEKLRAGEPFTDADRDYNNKALVSTLKQIHDDLDLAVLDAYGWPHNITDEQILENLVALNAERAEEERNGLIRWLRPDYQNPGQAPTEAIDQPTLEGITPTEAPIIEPVEQQKWPAQPKEQLAAIRDLLRTTPGEWSTKQIAAQFKGRTTQKKLDAITENLQRLEWFGLVICDPATSNWHYAESAQAA